MMERVLIVGKKEEMIIDIKLSVGEFGNLADGIGGA
tara:strand:- start:1617 stop:1724 length:108 start_codon:yes stop_codon:yes gene_type:complete